MKTPTSETINYCSNGDSCLIYDSDGNLIVGFSPTDDPSFMIQSLAIHFGVKFNHISCPRIDGEYPEKINL